MKERVFRFKRFSVNHSRSAMKVGVDGVLIGAWAHIEVAQSILDAGCGCGMIALMAAQRNPDATIDAVDIDIAAAAEAEDNFNGSPWRERLHAWLGDLATEEGSSMPRRYDCIVSNPPFFDTGVRNADTSRMKARHALGFSPFTLPAIAAHMLSEGGRLALITPYDTACRCVDHALVQGFFLSRECDVRGHDSAPFKRTMLEFVYHPAEPVHATYEQLTLNSGSEPSAQYIELCHDFYLKF